MSFTYDDNGIRTSKTVNNVKHSYYLSGSQIVAEQWSDKLLVYLYDASGSPIGMMYRTTAYASNVWDTFFFEKNLQGDIVAVYGKSGTKYVTYEYDAWGNQTVSYSNGGGSTGAQYNPFRYRGYYYDTDLGMYYLRSRYYDPNTCRFINADVYISTGYGIIGNNMFAYCNNIPTCYSDPEGTALSYTCDLDEGYDTEDDYWRYAGGGAASSYFGPGTAYHNYSVYSNTAAYDAYRGGYYYSGGGTIGGYTAQFAFGQVTVTDSMATENGKKGSYNFKALKSEEYMSKRGWDERKIQHAIKYGKQGSSINRHTNSRCTVYFYPGTNNQYVVIDDITKSIVQLSKFNDPGWIVDRDIIWPH